MTGDESGLNGWNPPPVEDRLGFFLTTLGFNNFVDGIDEKRTGKIGLDWWPIETDKLACVVVAHCMNNRESPGFRLVAAKKERRGITRFVPYITVSGRKILMTHARYNPDDRTIKIRLVQTTEGATKFLYKTIPELREMLGRSTTPPPPTLPQKTIRGFLKNIWKRRPRSISPTGE